MTGGREDCQVGVGQAVEELQGVRQGNHGIAVASNEKSADVHLPQRLRREIGPDGIFGLPPGQQAGGVGLVDLRQPLPLGGVRLRQGDGVPHRLAGGLAHGGSVVAADQNEGAQQMGLLRCQVKGHGRAAAVPANVSGVDAQMGQQGGGIGSHLAQIQAIALVYTATMPAQIQTDNVVVGGENG